MTLRLSGKGLRVPPDLQLVWNARPSATASFRGALTETEASLFASSERWKPTSGTWSRVPSKATVS